MKQSSSIISGLAGSIALTIFHELLKRNTGDAPRMDKLGQQGISKILSATGNESPAEDDLQKLAFGGDIISNTAFYSLVGVQPKHSLAAGSLLGLAAGIGAVVLPGKIGLNQRYSNRTTKTRLLSIAIYLAGGIVAGGVYKLLHQKN